VDGVTTVIPCAFHIDHHEPVEDNIPVDLLIRSKDVGSTSTIMAYVMNELKPELNLTKKLRMRAATALYYGIQTDTDDFKHAETLDEAALDIISPDCDKRLLRKLSTVPFSKEFMEFFNHALKEQILYKDWLISGIGFIDEKHRDLASIIGDFLLRREDISTAVVYSVVERKKGLTLNVSFRTKTEDFNLNEFIKRITSEGGGRKFKGAYQVNLDYFIHCTDRELLWKAISMTTLEVLKNQRDAHGFEGIKSYFRRIGGKFLNLFR
jgi:nanoRNase/pAp phosphatase (c-di-AMP/oligoRNAs hydrolase)